MGFKKKKKRTSPKAGSVQFYLNAESFPLHSHTAMIFCHQGNMSVHRLYRPMQHTPESVRIPNACGGWTPPTFPRLSEMFLFPNILAFPKRMRIIFITRLVVLVQLCGLIRGFLRFIGKSFSGLRRYQVSKPDRASPLHYPTKGKG